MNTTSGTTDVAWLNIKEAAGHLKVSVHLLYRLVALGKQAKRPIPVSRIGKLLRFEKGTLDAWAKGNTDWSC